MKSKFFTAAMFAAILLFAMTACGKTQSQTASERLDSAGQQTEQQNDMETPAKEVPPTHGDEDSKNESGQDETPSIDGDKASEDEAWKETFEKRLLDEYGVTPENYEDLGDGIYQVYVMMGDQVVPFVTVDSATGDFHG